MTLCMGEGCPLKSRCLRYRTIGHGRFDSFGASPYDHQRGACDPFIDLEARRPGEAQIRDRAYYIWLAAGRPQGQAAAHWAQAQVELRSAFERDLRPVG